MTGGARYDDVIAGHEPSGQVVEVGEGVLDFREGDRVLVYHIQGCGYCDECRKGFFINCQNPERRAYGWQRDGALAEYMVADVSTCIHLSDFLTYEDGAMVSCGFGTAWQGLLRAGVSGADRVLVMGLGPVGRAALILAKALGEQGTVTIEPSPLLLHKNLTLYGSWVTSVANMERLVEFLARRQIHPNDIITHRFALKDTDKAYAIFATGKTGKVCVNMEME